MSENFDSKQFVIRDVYDLKIAEYEKYRDSYEDGSLFGDDEDREGWETPDECRERLLGSLRRGERYVLQSCTSQEEEVTIPYGVTEIGYGAFAGNAALRRVHIPRSVTAVGSRAFYGCTALEEIDLHDNITVIGSDAFCGCSALKRVDLPDGLTCVSAGAFMGCISLEEVRFGNNVRGIGSFAFKGCGRLQHVSLPHSMGLIASYAFEHSGLESILLPPGLEEIEYGAFAFCGQLTRAEVADGNENFFVRDNCIFRGRWGSADVYELICGFNDGTVPDGVPVGAIGEYAYAGNPRVVTLSFPGSVKEICWCAYNGCKNLISLTLPENLESIGTDAFNGCVALEELTVKGNYKKIDRHAFSFSGIKKAVLKRGVEEICDGAFFRCESLREIYFPSTLRKVGFNVFGYCDKALRILIESGGEENYKNYESRLNNFTVAFCPSDIFD